MTESMIVVDVGSGTQDVLLYQPEELIGNCVQNFLYLMGGGACSIAV